MSLNWNMRSNCDVEAGNKSELWQEYKYDSAENAKAIIINPHRRGSGRDLVLLNFTCHKVQFRSHKSQEKWNDRTQTLWLEFSSCHLWNKKTKHSCTTKRAAPTETQASPSVNARPLVHTLVLERWLGSSLDCSFPAPSVGSWVWKTVTRPPVGDMSLKAACNAGPRALWVSLLWLNMAGREVSRSFTSWRRGGGAIEETKNDHVTTSRFECKEETSRERQIHTTPVQNN